MIPSLEDTIVALSSAPPRASGASGLGRAIIRLSGPDAFTLAGKLIDGFPGSKGESDGWRRIAVQVRWRSAQLSCAVYRMPGPRSYTRQDVLELHLPAITRCVTEFIDALVREGARPALPGEFTRRALMNGRISLEQAEAIGALIRTESAAEARESAKRATRREASQRSRLRADIEELLSLLELGLDFSLEDIELLPQEQLANRLEELVNRASGAVDQGGEGAGLQFGCAPRVVLCGPTNAGKSTLFNALLGRDEAIVSGDHHTTRDVVRAEFEPQPGVPMILLDTAGTYSSTTRSGLLSQALDAMESTVASADILVFLVDTTIGGIPAPEIALLQHLFEAHTPEACMVVWSKSDIPCASYGVRAKSDVLAALKKAVPRAGFHQFSLSATLGIGLGELRAALALEGQRLLQRLTAARASGAAVAAEFERQAHKALTRARKALNSGLTEDAVAVELREAVHALAQADGVLLTHDAVTEGILGRIFSDFCIGK